LNKSGHFRYWQDPLRTYRRAAEREIADEPPSIAEMKMLTPSSRTRILVTWATRVQHPDKARLLLLYDRMDFLKGEWLSLSQTY
jgi:hypothetical protein